MSGQYGRGGEPSTPRADEERRPVRATPAGRRAARWALACAAAEAAGLTVAAAASRAADGLVDRAGGLVLAWLVVLAAGVAEGTALGVAQARALRRDAPLLRTVRFVVATVLVAGVGWSLGTLPSLLATDEGAEGPVWPLLLLAGAGLGLGMGAALGAAQAWTMRAAVGRPGVWVLASAVAWVLAMAVIMVGAGTPGEEWSIPVVLAWACGTGLLGGAVLGGLLSLAVPRLEPVISGWGDAPPRT